MFAELKENISHGTPDCPYAQHFIHDVRRTFQFPVHWHEETEIIYITQGSLEVVIDGSRFTGKAGDIFFVNPRQLHLMGSPDGSAAYHTLLFPLECISFQTMDHLEQALLQPLRTSRLLIRNAITDERLLSALAPLLEELIAVNEVPHPAGQIRTRILLLQVLLCLYESPHGLLSASSPGNQAAQKEILLFIQAHYTEKLTLSVMAEQFHFSEKYFSRFFKEHFCMTFTDYVIHLRLAGAKRQLETTELSVTEIASREGFSNLSHFIRSFKSAYGISPLRYRKEAAYKK